jgi:FkbM family methyltransferase
MFKILLKNFFNLFGLRIINLRKQKKNYKNFSYYETFKKTIELFKDKKIIIFDVGTNVGQFLGVYLEVLNDLSIKNYEIHCFEPNVSLIKDLRKYSKSNIFINNLAISNEIGEKSFFIHDISENSSFYKYKHIKEKKEIKIETTTLDEYCKIKNISKINFLKIDTEGAEPQVLEGAKNQIKNDKVDCVLSELSIGKLFDNIDHSISSLEKYMYEKFQLVGIGLNRDYYKDDTDSDFLSFIHCLDQKDKAFTFSQIYLYVNKKVLENSKLK